tara:strand:+ start:254 stop:862 length:609 start_codon:yes stop_codon:yes gene_type:complete
MQDNTTWFNADFTNVEASGIKRQAPAEGLYQIKIESAEVRPSKNIAGLNFVMMRANIEGYSAAIFLNVPFQGNAEDKNTHYLRTWKTALLSCGYPADQITGGQEMGPGLFIGKTGWVYFTPGGENGRDNTKMLTPEQAEQVKSGQLVIAADNKAKAPATMTGGLAQAIGSTNGSIAAPPANFAVQGTQAAGGSALSSLLGNN